MEAQGRFVHEEPRSKRKYEVRQRGRVATVLVTINESPLQKSSKAKEREKRHD